jgi:hypothetical protein
VQGVRDGKYEADQFRFLLRKQEQLGANHGQEALILTKKIIVRELGIKKAILEGHAGHAVHAPEAF